MQRAYHITIPVTPPKNVELTLAMRLNVVSPLKRASDNWPMKLHDRNQYSSLIQK